MTTLDLAIALANERRARPIPDVIETPRLILRASKASDLAESYAASLESVDALKAWMPWAHPAPNLESMRNYFNKVEDDWDARTTVDFQWLDRATGQLVGKGGFHHIDWQHPRVEIGYWLRSSAIGHGYCTEAVNALTDYAKTHLGAVRAEIRSAVENAASRAVAERCGYALEGVMRSSVMRGDGSLCDGCHYAKLF